MTVIVGISKNDCTGSEERESEQLHREPRYLDLENIRKTKVKIRARRRRRR
jgi:hypothetical protein